MEDISFDRIPGLMDLLARMERFSLDSPASEYLAICSDIQKVWGNISETLDHDGDGRMANAVIKRIYGTHAYLSYRTAAKELFARPFFDGVEYLQREQLYEQATERREQRYQGLASVQD